MRLKLAYGRDGLWIDLPDEASVTVIEPRFVPGLPDEQATITDALRAPIGTPSLRQLIQPAGPEGPTCAQQVDRLEEARLTLAVSAADQRDARGQPQIDVDEVAEVLRSERG